MPIKKRKQPTDDPRADELYHRLVKEWTQPQDAEPEPVIIEDFVTEQHAYHIYVIWGEWDGLGQRERSDIIINAYGVTHKPEELLQVTVAMGLTPEEAKHMGIEYE